MMKLIALLTILLFATSAFAVTTTTKGNIFVDYRTENNADYIKTTKGTGTAGKAYTRVEGQLVIDSKVNEELSGRMDIEFRNNTTNGDDYVVMGDTADYHYLAVDQIYFDYKPIEGLNIRAGIQDIAIANEHVYSPDKVDGYRFTYEMPEMLKADFVYVINENDQEAGTYVVDKAIKNDKTWGIALNTPMVPFLQDLNLIYLSTYMSDEAAAAVANIDLTLVTYGLQAGGNAELGSINLKYGAEYYMQSGENKTGPTAIKYGGTLMGANLGLEMKDMFGLSFGAEYSVASGDKNDDAAKEKAWADIGADWDYTDSEIITELKPTYAAATATGTAGETRTKITIGAVPVEKLKVTVDYLMVAGTEKTAFDSAKTGLFTAYQLGLAYVLADNLKVKGYYANITPNKDNFAAAKDANQVMRFNAKYSF
jgi:hypothetical protein